MFERRSVDFETISAPFTLARSGIFGVLLLRRRGFEWDCDVLADVDNGWGECIVPIGSEIYAWNVRLDSPLILSYFLNYFIFHVKKGIKNGCPYIVEIGGT